MRTSALVTRTQQCTCTVRVYVCVCVCMFDSGGYDWETALDRAARPMFALISAAPGPPGQPPPPLARQQFFIFAQVNISRARGFLVFTMISSNRIGNRVRPDGNKRIWSSDLCQRREFNYNTTVFCFRLNSFRGIRNSCTSRKKLFIHVKRTSLRIANH